MTLEVFWYLVIISSLICYAVLDGFDLGVGSLHLFTKKDEERRVFLNAIGPVWDGNEVWLVIVGGALFAGFPNAYATLFSSFYNFVMLLLCGLIFRAVAIEFRSKHESRLWRQGWDITFSLASVAIAFGIGFVLGNLIQGIALDEHQNFVGSSVDFFNPYAVLLGVLTVSLFMMHGCIFLLMKTEGELHDRLRKWVNRCIGIFISWYVIASLATLFYIPHMTERMEDHPSLFLIPVVTILAILNVPYQAKKRRNGWAFLSSCLSIACLLALFAIGTYPRLIRSSIDPENNSLVIANSASSPLTLTVLTIIVAIGIPLVLAYGAYVYHLFRGKVKIEPTSY